LYRPLSDVCCTLPLARQMCDNHLLTQARTESLLHQPCNFLRRRIA
jgi:hypothetical protein